MTHLVYFMKNTLLSICNIKKHCGVSAIRKFRDSFHFLNPSSQHFSSQNHDNLWTDLVTLFRALLKMQLHYSQSSDKICDSIQWHIPIRPLITSTPPTPWVCKYGHSVFKLKTCCWCGLIIVCKVKHDISSLFFWQKIKRYFQFSTMDLSKT